MRSHSFGFHFTGLRRHVSTGLRANSAAGDAFYLHLRNELWKLFGKKRTYIGFGAFLLAQNGMLLMFRFTKWQKS